MERQCTRERNVVAVKRGVVLVGLMFLLFGLLFLSALGNRKEVIQAEDLSDLRFGYPIALIVQDQSRLDPPTYPTVVHILSPLEYPTHVLWFRVIAIMAVCCTLAKGIINYSLHEKK